MSRRALVLFLWLMMVSGRLLAQPDLGRTEFRTGADVYREACIACHGADGRGSPPAVVGFAVPLPDFTDCLFATVEGGDGWEAVVHQGGPVRALDRHMPAFGEALSAAEISLVVAHVRTFCPDHQKWPSGDLNLPRALVTEKAFPENETILTTSWLTGPVRSISNAIVHERRLGALTTVEVRVPFEVQHGDGDTWRYGLGDVAAAIKRTLIHRGEQGTILSAGGEVLLPTGKEAQGLGGGVTILEAAVTAGQLLPHESFVQAHGGVAVPARPTRASREAFWRVALGKTLTQRQFGRTWTPILEFVAARPLDADARVEWDIVPQMQVSLSKRRHVLFSAGVQVPATVRVTRHPQVLSYLLWDFYEGGLFDGWR